MSPVNSQRYHPLLELILSRVREFFREPEAIFWVYVFPVLLAVALGIAFRTPSKLEVRVAVEEAAAPGPLDGALPPAEAAARLREDPRFRVELEPAEAAAAALKRGRIDLVLRVDRGYRYVGDFSRPEAALARELTDAVLRGRRDAIPSADEPVTAPGSRYIDFLIPGLIGMNIMGGGFWGVGFVIVEMRVRKLLKRFVATPMSRSDFLLSVIGSRMLFLVPEIGLLLLVGALGFGVPIAGSAAALAAIVLVSAFSFSGMGLLTASRARKIETISGILNLVMLPMWILSGIFFSAERFPEFLQPAIHALPLTASIDALRAVMLEGQSLASQWAELLNLGLWGGVSYALSLRWFRWS
jgi:ABC-2 type transport system permease protein